MLWLQRLNYVSQPTETRRCEDNAPVCVTEMTSWSLTDLSALGIHWVLSSGKRMRERRWIRYVITLEPPLSLAPLPFSVSALPLPQSRPVVVERPPGGERTNDLILSHCFHLVSLVFVLVSLLYVLVKSSSGVRPSWCDPLWRSGIFTVFLAASVCWKWFLGFQSSEMARRFRMDGGISAVILLLLSVLSQHVSTEPT